LLASPNNKAEKDHPDDISLAGDGFDTVAKAKAAVDSDPQCRNKVSCADILALATRDVINLVHNFYITFLLEVTDKIVVFLYSTSTSQTLSTVLTPQQSLNCRLEDHFIELNWEGVMGEYLLLPVFNAFFLILISI